MELTQNFVRAKSPCAPGFRWFLRRHPQGGDYQQLLDALVADGRADDACWLLAQFGPTNAVLRLESLECESIVFAGSIEVRGDIGGVLVRAARRIRAGGAIRATRLQAGDGIVAGGLLEAGSVSAGDDLQLAALHAEGAVQCGGHLRCARDVVCEAGLDVAGQGAVGGMLVAGGATRFGRSLRLGGALRVAGALRVGEGLLAGGDIDCEGHLDAGWGIRSDGTIRCGGAIRAGETLQAAGEIAAGAGYGVYAGLSVQREAWDSSGWVSAALRPRALRSGRWVGEGGRR